MTRTISSINIELIAVYIISKVERLGCDIIDLRVGDIGVCKHGIVHTYDFVACEMRPWPIYGSGLKQLQRF